MTHRANRTINLVWAILIGATLASWWLAEGPSSHTPGLLASGFVLLLSAVKGWLIALNYMELRGAHKLWRNLILIWLCALLLIIFGSRFFS